MQLFDLRPLYRTVICVNRLANLFDDALRAAHAGYLPFNVKPVKKDKCRITASSLNVYRL